MERYYRIPLIFLLIAAGIGLFLRWQFVAPTAGIRYTYFLHGHSHVMFLGWVFNVLLLAFIEHHMPAQETARHTRFFIMLQILVVAMMISFPLQGYGLYSIIFSTSHTIAVMIFIPVFFKKTLGDSRVSTWFARIAWLFFVLSTAGPFALGFLMANGLGQSVWYNFSIYYYLHFQYNGFFLFGILSLFFHMLETKQIPFRADHVLRFGKWMAFACIPAYVLSTLLANSGIWLNIIGGVSALIQMFATVFLLQELTVIRQELRERFHSFSLKLLRLVGVAFVVKCILQLASAHPFFAALAYSTRPVVIAYLHLVLVGIITLFLMAWYIDRRLLEYRLARYGVLALLTGFIGSELCLVLMPWLDARLTSGWSRPIFVLSALMLIGIFFIVLSCSTASRESASTRDHLHDKNQSLT